MIKAFRYNQKNVQDIPSENGLVRVWDATGSVDKRGISKGFENLLRTGFIFPYVALMPDHHPAEDTMVGSVIPTRDVLLLSVVGGDLGCGVTAVKLPVTEEEVIGYLPQIHADLHDAVPCGSAHNRFVTDRVSENPLWEHQLQANILTGKIRKKLMLQFATLGGGNHFLELQKDDTGDVWIMLHSGSRYLGVLIKDHYIEVGATMADVDRSVYRRTPYLPVHSALADSYLHDLGFALDFARESRREMMLRSIEIMLQRVPALHRISPDVIFSEIRDVAHNYVSKEEHFGETLYIHRKGAVRAGEGETVMIPGSMGTSSYIATGKGNSYSFCSCSHGAGRTMSRHAARKAITDKEYEQSTAGVLHTRDVRLKDEAPGAYKCIRAVMRGQKDLVKIESILTPILSMKGVG